MTQHCAPKKIFLIRLKITPFRFERVKQFVQQRKDEFCLCTSYLVADYIVTELKSPSRIVRNAKQSTCPVVHMNWILDSLSSNKVVNPEKYMVDVSAARAIDVPVPYKSPSYKPLPRQVKWSQLADIHNKALADSGVVTTFRFTTAYEKRRHFAHRQREKKSKKRKNKDHGKVQSYKEENSQIKRKDILNTTKHEDAYIKQEAECSTRTSIKSEGFDIVKQEPVDQDCTFQFSSNKSCSSSSFEFDQQPSSLPEITT